jgi:hypothetical protein
MSRLLIHLTLALAVSTAALGCGSNLLVLNPRVARSPAVYESDQAAHAFKQAVDERYENGEAIIGKTAQLSENAFFNQQLQVADGNIDGIISDGEAHRYATSINRQ